MIAIAINISETIALADKTIKNNFSSDGNVILTAVPTKYEINVNIIKKPKVEINVEIILLKRTDLYFPRIERAWGPSRCIVHAVFDANVEFISPQASKNAGIKRSNPGYTENTFTAD